MGDTLTLMYSFIMKIKVHILISHCLQFIYIVAQKKKSFYPVNIKRLVNLLLVISHITTVILQSRIEIESSIRLEQKNQYIGS